MYQVCFDLFIYAKIIPNSGQTVSYFKLCFLQVIVKISDPSSMRRKSIPEVTFPDIQDRRWLIGVIDQEGARETNNVDTPCKRIWLVATSCNIFSNALHNSFQIIIDGKPIPVPDQ